MRQPPALPLAALLTALLTLSWGVDITQASADGPETAVSTAQAVKGKQCMPSPARQSLIVRGKVTCTAVKRFLPSAREVALNTQTSGYEQFTIRGFRCELRPDYKRFACHDINDQPKRSFVWADKT